MTTFYQINLPMLKIAAIFIGGGLGSVLRFGVGNWIGNNLSHFPLGTFIANISATAVLGLGMLLIAQREDAPIWMSAFLLTGFCGGFSTFSTFSMDTAKLIESGQTVWALLNIIASVVICTVVAFLLIKKS
ncbi:MAG: fluoride efflux transporter CrcB [Flavobacteriales bacterium]|nr:fluoride efflux transporter CrcB [Flavobacteriales bacterium]MDG1781070.1 fluoride efflux transporter CrcB [Flavobacteriales bacterium]MDG2246232.1 fluoride efflux transporter CrcB [Flavobacteriales bacterium]